ncbi:MAG: TonB-dependent receptor domain-containing protein, partial [Candidatus Hinthialibacter sp.]
MSFTVPTQALAQQAGGIRGVIYDKDFEAPLGDAQILIAETGEKVNSAEEGNYVFGQVAPGNYTLVFSKDGYIRLVKANVVVSPGSMTELDVWLSGNFTEMEEFIVQDVQIGVGTEASLLDLRMESPSLMDSISADLMSQAGASDAAGALNLVAGASVQDGKYAVIRGLPDRYVNSQMNGVRLPTADADKRAVQLDQFPSTIIESIQVTKTFLPDQQGDASGGAVNVMLKGIPNETVLGFSSQASYNSQAGGEGDFLTYKGGGVNFWGDDSRDIPSDGSFDETVGVSVDDAPVDSKWSLMAGGKREWGADFTLGGLASFYYERDSSYFDDGIDDQYWVENPGGPMSPQYIQGTPTQGDFKSQLFDVTQGAEEVKWGALGAAGIETENHSLSLSTLYTRAAEDKATLAEDVRGKQYYFPGYDRYDPHDPGNLERDAAPYLRTETLEYTERTTQTMQLRGRHHLPDPHVGIKGFLTSLNPEVDWGYSINSAEMHQPDKRQFGSAWWAESYNPGYPPYIDPFVEPELFRPFKPAANFTLGNLQRIWKDITEDSDQYYLNLKFPYEQWTGDQGYLKFGYFNDQVDRAYNQDSFSNFNDNSSQYQAPWETYWSEVWPSENHPMTPANIDVDYDGEQDISAWYSMTDLPLNSKFKLIGGARYEQTDIGITNYPEDEVTWIPPGAAGSVELKPGQADVSYSQNDLLPSIGLVFTPVDQIKLHGSYSQTVARQTFKELTPIQQQEYLGSDVFIGNPFLTMSDLENYDLRFDYTPYNGSLISLSFFQKDIENPIEYVQRIADYAYTTPVNYPKGEISGHEIEIRQDLGRFW